MGVLDRGTRLQPEIALQSAASASDVLIDTRGGIVRRPGFEDQGLQLDYEFVTIPYFTENETYLLVITYGDHILHFGDPLTTADPITCDHTGSGSGDQILGASGADFFFGKYTAANTQFTGKIYLYKTSQVDSETGSADVGFVTQEHWATTENDYLFGPTMTLRRGQGAVTVGVAVPDLTHYLHPWTREQCQGMQYAQHGSRLYLFTDGFPTIEIQNSNRTYSNITSSYTYPEAPHASLYPETSNSESTAATSASSNGAWDFEVDALDPEVSRRANPPINLLLTKATELVASDDFFTSDMEGGFISYGSAQFNDSDGAEPGDWFLSGVLLRIVNVHNTRVAEVVGLEDPSSVGDLVPEAYTTGADIYDHKKPGTSVALVPGDISTLTDTMMGDWAGPWVRVKGMSRETTGGSLAGSHAAGMKVVPPVFVPLGALGDSSTAAIGSPHFGWDAEVNVGGDATNDYNAADRVTAGVGHINGQNYYYCNYVDGAGGLSEQLVDLLGLSEKDVGSIVLIRDGSSDYLFYLYHVTGLGGTTLPTDYTVSTSRKFHFQFYGKFNSSFVRQDIAGYAADLTFAADSEVALLKVKAPYVLCGCMGWNADPRTGNGQTNKATIYVNDPQFLPANLHTANRPIKRGGVTQPYTTGANGLQTTTIDRKLDAPLIGGSSIFFRNGVFRPTARISEVCYEGYWETAPTVPTPQGFISFGSGGSTGFATCGAAHQGRLVVGGFGGAFEDAVVFSRTAQPRIMMSPHIDSADDAFSIQLGQNTEEQVSWFGSMQVGLVVGGQTGEYIVRGEPISALKLAFQRISGVGGGKVRAAYTDNELVFVCRDKRAVGGVQVQEGADQSTFSLRLSDRASSLFTNDILQSGYIYSPHPTFFYLMDNGTILAYTRDQSIGGFTTLSHADGTIKSLSSAVRSTKISDTLFSCVQRTINGVVRNRLERMNFTAILDSQRCTNQYTVASFGGVSDVEAVTTTKVRFLDPWAGQTLHLVTVDSSGNRIYRGSFAVAAETIGTETTYSIDMSSLGLSTAPTKVITGFNFDGVFEPSSVTEVPGYICSYTSGIMLGESVTGLAINKGDIVPVKTNEAHLSSSGWLNVYNLGHFSRDAGPEFTLKGPFSSTVQAISIEVESKE